MKAGMQTVFPMAPVRKNFPGFVEMRRAMDPSDAAAFFMVADASCSTKPTADIEKIHVDVFARKRAVVPTISDECLETLEILSDPDLMRRLRESDREMREGKTVPWEEVRKSL